MIVEGNRAAAAESISVASKNPFAYFDSLNLKKLSEIRGPFVDRVQKALPAAAAAETTVLKALNVPVVKFSPRYESTSYGWQSRDRTFTFLVDSKRLQFEALIFSIAVAIIVLLLPMINRFSKKDKNIPSRSAT